LPIFPGDFLWGATVSAHSVEGADYASDWWRWEQRPDRIQGGATSQVAAGHLERFAADAALARKLGHNAVLLSLSWPRIEPEPGHFDQEALAHYGAVLQSVRAHDLEPLCVLQHGTVPAWLDAQGAWEQPQAAGFFAAYTKQVAAALGALCRWWIPLFEPEHGLTMAYREARWPGAKRRILGYRVAAAALARAQALAYAALHEGQDNVRVGASVRGDGIEALDGHSPWDLRAARWEQARRNHTYLARLTGLSQAERPFDFIGVSDGGRHRVRFAALSPRSGLVRTTDDLGRDASAEEGTPDPEGLGGILTGLKPYGVPLLLTGAGVATADDAVRCAFLYRCLAALKASLERGDAPELRGFFYRSLLDGFEWTRGYTARYGLVHVDWSTLARTPNGSAFLYKDVCERGWFRQGSLDRFCPGWESFDGVMRS